MQPPGTFAASLTPQQQARSRHLRRAILKLIPHPAASTATVMDALATAAGMTIAQRIYDTAPELTDAQKREAALLICGRTAAAIVCAVINALDCMSENNASTAQ